MSWWYLSFSSDDGWLGACIVEAPNEMLACMQAHSLGINPGGEVLLGNLTAIDAVPSAEFRNILLTKNDLKALDLFMGGDGIIEDFYT